MEAEANILELAYKRPFLQEDLELLHTREKNLPGQLYFTMRRYRMQPQWSIDDTGMLAYQYEKGKNGEKYMELRFCISGNRYCSKTHCSEGSCAEKHAGDCKEQTDTFDVFSFRYSAAYLRQFVSDKATESDALLQFKRRNSFTNVVSLCNRTRSILENIVASPYEGAFENIFFAGQVHSLLLYGLECLVEDKAAESFSCGFLSQESDREKMLQAKDLLHQHIGNPITIKELSRKVGTNECYLKKGFKEMFGTTIFDYYQRKRMEHATFLLNEKGLSVTEVSMLLGYSSISHFSTAFKKHTGIKPCELLLR